MKENEEITNLERFELLIEDCKGHRELYGESFVGEYDIEIMQHILSDYKRVLKENEELRKKLNEENKRCMMLAIEKQDYFEKYRYHLQQNESLTKEFSNVIPIQKIKDIIDRIDYDIKKTKEIISNNSNIYTSDRRNDYQIVRLKAMNTKSLDIKKRLQELLESEE